MPGFGCLVVRRCGWDCSQVSKLTYFSQRYIVSLCLKSIGFRSTPRRLGKVYCSNRPGAIFFLKDGVWTELAGGEGEVRENFKKACHSENLFFVLSGSQKRGLSKWRCLPQGILSGLRGALRYCSPHKKYPTTNILRLRGRPILDHMVLPFV